MKDSGGIGRGEIAAGDRGADSRTTEVSQMWSRVVEIMLGCWLLISPFVFGNWPRDAFQRANDLAAGSIVIACGLLSHWRPLRRAHLATLAVGVWLIAFAYVRAGASAAPPVQNDAVLGLLLLTFGIVPSDASRPPESWARPA